VPALQDLNTVRRRLRQRSGPLVLALLVEALLLYLIFTAVWTPPARKVRDGGATFQLQPAAADKADTAKRAAERRPAETRPPTPTPPPPPVPVPPLRDAMIIISREDFASGDIAKLARPDDGGGSRSAGTQAAQGVGEGPDGAPLYNAEWYREPTPGEMALYLPANRPPGSWGVIVCKTIPRNRVDDCRTLGESPLGSGIARALRQASWQFLVRPPRIGDKPQIGVWVRIRFDFTKEGDGRFGGTR
jgi:hypothetical protein